jgi:surface protein
MPQKFVGDAAFELTAPTSNSAGAFTYSSSNLAVATVSGTTVTIVGAGSTTITATQAATATYASNSISASLVVMTLLSLDSNGITIKYNGNAADVPTDQYRFIYANVRGYDEMFAIMKNSMKGITMFQLKNGSYPVSPNNIVTTLMTNMEYLFYNATEFNQPIASWDTSNVTNMYGMFRNAPAFNQTIGSWNTANVTNMGIMFYDASAFNQDISGWNVASVGLYSLFSDDSALIDENKPKFL